MAALVLLPAYQVAPGAAAAAVLAAAVAGVTGVPQPDPTTAAAAAAALTVEPPSAVPAASPAADAAATTDAPSTAIAATVGDGDATTAAAAAAAPQSAAQPPAKRGRYAERGVQNKGRRAAELGYHAGSSGTLCRAVAAGRPCRFGDRCRDMHSVADFLAARPADLGDACPVAAARGTCPAGITCRWARSHTDSATGEQMTAPPPPGWTAPLNFLGPATFGTLRRGNYAYLATGLGATRADGGGGGAAGGAGDAGEAVDVVPAVAAAADVVPPVAAAAAAAAPVAAAADTATAAAETPVAAPTAATTLNKSAFALAAAGSAGLDTDKWAHYSPADARIRAAERRTIDFTDKVYVAPLTTVGNLPFRRVMVGLGADVTCGEMAMADKLVEAGSSEWALLRRHASERTFGVQLAGNNARTMAAAAELIERHLEVDFVDINSGCPLDDLCRRGAGAGLMGKPARLVDVLSRMHAILSCPVTLKLRAGLDLDPGSRFAHKLVQRVRLWSARDSTPGPLVSAITLHSRTRQQRYSKSADWAYTAQVAAAASGRGVVGWRSTLAAEGWSADELAELTSSVDTTDADCLHLDGSRLPSIPLIGNGDIMNWQDWYEWRAGAGTVTGLLARGALVKPWLVTEIKERRTIDMRSGERLDILRNFVNYGLEHWGSDQSGVNHTRRFLLEWLSFLHRYVPVGLLEAGRRQALTDRLPPFVGRDDLETLMGSPRAEDWVRISELLLGRVPADFSFVPKHRAAAYPVDGGAAGGGGGGVGRAGVTADALHGGAGVAAGAAPKRPRASGFVETWDDAGGSEDDAEG